jgi:dihydrofolate synthase/folylpolyglutamate synthase
MNKYLASLEKFGINLGLDRISILLDRLDDPQRRLKVIHVAGTNGKGSTCAMIASILKEAGFKVGLYTASFQV